MNLENLGVQEMSAEETMKIEGGVVGYLLGCLTGFLIEIASNPKNSEKQFMKGVNSYESMF